MFEQGSNRGVLAGTSILVTRGTHQAMDLSLKIIDLGGVVQEFPVIAIEPPKTYAELDQSLDQIQQYDWIVFASVNAVDYLLARYRQRELDQHLLQKCRIAAIGPATSNALARHGLNVHFMPKSFIAEALVKEFQSNFELAGRRLLWPRTTVGRQLISERLTAAGARVDMVTAYETGLPPESVLKADELLDQLENRKFDVILMASSQSVRNFAKILEIALQNRQSQSKSDTNNESRHSEQPRQPAVLGVDTPIPPAVIGVDTPIPPAVIGADTPIPPAVIEAETPIPPIVIEADTPIPPIVIEADTPIPPIVIEADTPIPPIVIEDEGRFLTSALGTAQILSIGPETSKTVEEHFGHYPLEARTFTIQGMIDRLVEYVQTCGNKSCSTGESETQADKLGKNL
jgi:uroporphyrinogen-III synthase